MPYFITPTVHRTFLSALHLYLDASASLGMTVGAMSRLHMTQQTRYPELVEGNVILSLSKEPALSLPKGLDASASLGMTVGAMSRLHMAQQTCYPELVEGNVILSLSQETSS